MTERSHCNCSRNRLVYHHTPISRYSNGPLKRLITADGKCRDRLGWSWSVVVELFHNKMECAWLWIRLKKKKMMKKKKEWPIFQGIGNFLCLRLTSLLILLQQPTGPWLELEILQFELFWISVHLFRVCSLTTSWSWGRRESGLVSAVIVVFSALCTKPHVWLTQFGLLSVCIC